MRIPHARNVVPHLAVTLQRTTANERSASQTPLDA
jgi:hypothetical protein